ncbi:MAG: AmmeMemoRadiSam system protein B [Bryobacteraceae bacterium]
MKHAWWPGSRGGHDGRDDPIRRPAVAGAFYPAEPDRLKSMVDSLLAEAGEAVLPDLVGLIAPHAGYEYSGAVAAHAYRLLRDRKPDRVVVIAPSHFENFPFASVYGGDFYSTPLGLVPIDRAFADALSDAHPLVRRSSLGHESEQERGEHSLEVQLPFLQRVLGEFQLVPVVMGDSKYDVCRALGMSLARLIDGSDTVLVASSDLSHYHPYSEAVELDRGTLDTIEAWNFLSLPRHEACGAGPIAAMMMAADRLNTRRARLVCYRNSGDATGDRLRVVGYGALACLRGEEPFELGEPERVQLRAIARCAVEDAVLKRTSVGEAASSGPLHTLRGAFVTLTHGGELRGCVGHTVADRPLDASVRESARMAACEDRRFPPMQAWELPGLEYEISVLSPMHLVGRIEEVEIGQHGVLVKQSEHVGVLLPRVALDHRFDRQELLSAACRKAGLAGDAWRDSKTDIYSFTAQVF